MAQTLTLDDLFSDAAAAQSGKPTKSDDEVLRQGLNRSGGSRNRGGGVSLGARERLNEQASSMIIDGVDYRDPQKPLGDQPSGRYDFDKQPAVVSEDPSDVVPTSSPVSNKKLKRIPLKDISSTRLLTEADIRELAMTKEFPVALQGSFRTGSSDPTLGGPMTTHQAEYEKLTDPFERERYLRERKEFLEGGQANEQFVEDLQDVQIPFTDIDALPIAAGLGAAGLVGGPLGASIAGGIVSFATFLVEAGIPLAKMAGAGYLVRKLYDDITSDPGITEEEATKKIQKEVQKQLEKQKDTGSAPIVEKQPDATKEQQVEAYDQGKPVNL
jgi:hypothetical protein